VKARTAHDRFGLTHIDMVRGGRGISKERVRIDPGMAGGRLNSPESAVFGLVPSNKCFRRKLPRIYF